MCSPFLHQEPYKFTKLPATSCRVFLDNVFNKFDDFLSNLDRLVLEVGEAIAEKVLEASEPGRGAVVK